MGEKLERGWLEIEILRVGAEVQVLGRGSRHERPAPHQLGPDLSVDGLIQFAEGVRKAAARGGPCDARASQAVHRAILRDELDEVRIGLRQAAGGGPLLVRLMISDRALQAIPWEALCEPGTAMGFWGSSPEILLASGVNTTEPWVPREVRGALRVLAIAPSRGASSDRVKEALAERIASGEVEWLDPIGPEQVRSAHHLLERLRREPVPHVIHFLGHGGIQDGRPVLQLAGEDEGGEAAWIPVELLAQQLQHEFGRDLRLIVLEACEGAQPGAFASAAELLARAGADAVVAHLWPVRADVARLCSQQFYRALASAGQRRGDVAWSLNEARRAILADSDFKESAEAFSPVLYLRSNQSALFDFERREVAPPPARPIGTRGAPGEVDPALERLVRGGPFSLVLGDRWKHERRELDAFREKLQSALASEPDRPLSGLPMSALAQRFAFRCGSERLSREFYRAFPPPDFASWSLVPPLARLLGPGVHVTLLRSPVLELALARHQPGRTIYAIQPGESWMLLRRPAGSDAWEEISGRPGSLDLRKDIVVLRLYSGYTPDKVFMSPLLTEDDYLLRVREFRDLEAAMGRDLADAIQAALDGRPALLLGLSILAWPHRVVLHRLFGSRPLPRGSLCGIEPDDVERELWESGASLPGRGGVAVVEAPVEDIAGWLEDLTAEGGSEERDLREQLPVLRRVS